MNILEEAIIVHEEWPFGRGCRGIENDICSDEHRYHSFQVGLLHWHIDIRNRWWAERDVGSYQRQHMGQIDYTIQSMRLQC